MNRLEARRCFVQRMKDNYPPGTRLVLLQMGDDPRPVEPNTRCTVAVVDDSFHIENNTAGSLRCIHKECAPCFPSTGRMVIYGFICCIFSCGCKRLCRSGQRPQQALP